MRRHIMPVGVCDRRAAVNDGRGASCSSDDLMYFLKRRAIFLIFLASIISSCPTCLFISSIVISFYIFDALLTQKFQIKFDLLTKPTKTAFPTKPLPLAGGLAEKAY